MERRECPGGRLLFQKPGDSGIWFDSDAIIDRRPNPLLAAVEADVLPATICRYKLLFVRYLRPFVDNALYYSYGLVCYRF